jgi:quercetin dioxygenase-like cupin family protein
LALLVRPSVLKSENDPMKENMPYWIKWEEMVWERVNDQISRKVVTRDRMMMVMYRFGSHLSWPEEVHEAEQGGYLIKGKLELTLPEKGEKVLLVPGDGYLIGSKVPHSWRTLEEETVFIDIFSPPRRELFREKFAPNAR